MLLIVCIIYSHTVTVLVIRDNLHAELKKLGEEKMYLTSDRSNIQFRWHTAREEKTRALNTLENLRRLKEELERLTEEGTQVDLDEKVV